MSGLITNQDHTFRGIEVVSVGEVWEKLLRPVVSVLRQACCKVAEELLVQMGLSGCLL